MLLNTVQGRDLCLRCIKILAFFILKLQCIIIGSKQVF
ncbi:Uncharacterised protein [Klebsiella pneumoniae]|nr:Uncharacterised protein [Klebsiella pneumoniae]